MDADLSPHQKKVRLMGTILAIISWIGLAFLGGVLALFVYFAVTNDTDLLAGYLVDFEIYGEEFEGLAESEIEEIIDLVYEDFFPEGITLDTTVRELIRIDREFAVDHLKYIGAHGLLTIAIYIVIAILFLRIAFAWRKGEPFSRATTMGLRWLGIILLVQFGGGILYSFFIPESITRILSGSEFYDTALEALMGAQGPNLEFGILFITLSWVLEHGRQIKEEQSLTV